MSEEGESKRSQIRKLREQRKEELKACGGGLKERKAIEKKFEILENAVSKGNVQSSENVCDFPTQDISHETLSWKVSEKAISKRQAKLLREESDYRESDRVFRESHKPDAARCKKEWDTIESLIKKDGELLSIKSVPSDGNCLFSAISIQCDNMSPDQLRHDCVQFLELNRQDYAPFIDEDFDSYCKSIKDGYSWGGELEFTILSKLLCRPIFIYKDGGRHVIGASEFSRCPIRLSFHVLLFSSPHYNAVI